MSVDAKYVGPILSEFHYQPHTNEVFHHQTQPSENLIYEHNQNLRKDNVLGDLSFGRQIASIPFIAWEKAIRDGYALNAKDAQIAEKELFRFLRSEEGRKCLVRDKV